MVCLPLGQEGTKLLPDGLDDVWLDGGHGTYSFCSGSLEDSPNDGVSVPALHVQAMPIDGRSQRHRDAHLPLSLLKAQEAEEVGSADRIVAEIRELKEDVHRLRRLAEESGDYRTAMAGFSHVLKAMELQAKLAQLVSDGPTINIMTNPQC